MGKELSKGFVLRAILLTLLNGAVVASCEAFLSGRQDSTPRQPTLPPWRPNRPPLDAHYVGDNASAQCHRSKVARQRTTGMARALELGSDSAVLRSHPHLSFGSGAYVYEIARAGDKSVYSVSDGSNKISEPIVYTFGQGNAGQTYVIFHDGSYYESRVSFYREIGGLDLTLGSRDMAPASLNEALGRKMSHNDARDCFGCHATGAVGGSQLQLEKLVPGIRCEACHGSGERHVGAMRSGSVEAKQIFNPGILSGDLLSQEFCGSCHRSVDEVFAMPQRGEINNLRFQPYRIFKSKCYQDDRRISCIACHDPHAELISNPAFYDSKCLSCHLSSRKPKRESSAKTIPETAERKPGGCTVEVRNCVTCHMPKIELPGAHFKFSDHWIRIVRPNEPVPY